MDRIIKQIQRLDPDGEQEKLSPEQQRHCDYLNRMLTQYGSRQVLPSRPRDLKALLQHGSIALIMLEMAEAEQLVPFTRRLGQLYVALGLTVEIVPPLSDHRYSCY